MTQTILVTGANGNVSTALISALKSQPVKVRAMVRNPAKVDALKAQGVEVVVGDLETPRSLPKAFDGVDKLFLLSSNGPRAPENHSNGIWAARQAGVSHIVRMSAIGAAHNAPTINSRLHALSDHELAISGVPYTVVKPHFFMQNLMMATQSVAKEGAMYLALGEGRMGMIDIRDIADFVARVFTSGGHLGQTYTLTGPESLNMNQVAEQLGVAVKKTVKYVPVSFEQGRQAMAGMGMDAYTVNLMDDYMVAYANQWGDLVTNTFQQVTGKAPRSWATFARDFAGAFGGK